MGLTMEFRLGHAMDLARAFFAAEFDRLEALSLGFADFSLHLSPSDLDLLTEELCRASGERMRAFTDVTGEPIAGDRLQRGVFLLSSAFVTMTASIREESAGEIAERWMHRVADESGNADLVADADSVLAVSALLSICRKAKLDGIEVVYCWSL